MGETTTPRTHVLTGLALLDVPAPDQLTDRQRAGAHCAFSGIPLTVTGAVDLGRRDTVRAGQPVTWYPRAYRGEIPRAALAALHAHTPDCASCRDGETANHCPTGTALRRLLREFR